MVFSTNDGSLFNVIKNIKSLSLISNEQNTTLHTLVDDFNRLSTSGKLAGDDLDKFTNKVKAFGNANLTAHFDQLAKSGNGVKASMEGVLGAVTSGHTTGLKNVASIINDFNNLASNPEDQMAYAKAVSQTNAQLGKYLLNLNGSTASMKDYGKQLVSARIQTVALQAKTIALNMALNVGITALVSLAAKGISMIINEMSNLADKISDLKSDLEGTQSEIEGINKTLEENRKKIEEINSNPLDITNEETLQTLQLENAELERQKRLLEELAEQQNKELNEKTAKYLNKNSRFNIDDYWSGVYQELSKKPFDNIADDWAKVFDKNSTVGERIGKALSAITDLTVFGFIDAFVPEMRSILDETDAFQQEFDAKITQIEDTLSKGVNANTDFEAFVSVNTDVDDLREELAGNIKTLTEYKDSLSKTSDEYKIVSENIEKYIDQLERLDNLSIGDYSGLTDTYFDIKDYFDNISDLFLGYTKNNNIDSSILDMLGIGDKDGYKYFNFAGSLIEQYQQAQKALEQFGTIELDRQLTFDESEIKSRIQDFVNTNKNLIDKYSEEYFGGKSSEASIIFSNYVDKNSIKDIAEETYDDWKNGLLEQANSDSVLVDILEVMVKELKPQIDTIIDEKKYSTTTNAVNELGESFASLKEKIDKSADSKKLFDKSIEAISSGESISSDDMWKLIEIDDSLADKFVQTTDGYVIAIDELSSAKDRFNSINKKALENEIKTAEALRDEAEANISIYTEARDKILNGGIGGAYDAKELSKYNNLIKEEESNRDKVNSIIAKGSLLLGEYNKTLSNSSDYLEALSKSISAYTNNQKAVQAGVEGHEEELKQLEKQLEEYSKKRDKVFEDEIEHEKKYIEYLEKQYNDLIDKQIDRINNKKDAIESAYDTEIDKIDETIDALKTKNEEDKSALDIAQAELDIEKAKQELEKAKQRTRKVYGADGTVQYRQDADEIANAQKSLADAEQKLTDLKLDQIVDGLEKQKEVIEEEKQAELDKYDEMITALNEGKDNQDSHFKTLIEILDTYLNPNTTESISSVWDRVWADIENVQAEDGKVTVKDTPIDTRSDCVDGSCAIDYEPCESSDGHNNKNCNTDNCYNSNNNNSCNTNSNCIDWILPWSTNNCNDSGNCSNNNSSNNCSGNSSQFVFRNQNSNCPLNNIFGALFG